MTAPPEYPKEMIGLVIFKCYLISIAIMSPKESKYPL